MIAKNACGAADASAKGTAIRYTHVLHLFNKNGESMRPTLKQCSMFVFAALAGLSAHA